MCICISIYVRTDLFKRVCAPNKVHEMRLSNANKSAHIAVARDKPKKMVFA